MELLQLISSGDTAEYVSKHALAHATAELLSCAQSLTDVLQETVMDRKYIQLTVYLVQEMERRVVSATEQMVQNKRASQLVQLTTAMSNISNTSVKVSLACQRL